MSTHPSMAGSFEMGVINATGGSEIFVPSNVQLASFSSIGPIKRSPARTCFSQG